jgi:hypothetical protein
MRSCDKLPIFFILPCFDDFIIMYYTVLKAESLSLNGTSTGHVIFTVDAQNMFRNAVVS